MALVLFGCGAAVISGGNVEGGPAGLGLLGISLAFGFAVVAMAYTIGGISCCHINPAIFAGGKALSQLWLFIVAPVVGAVAAAIVWKLTGEDK